MKEWLKEWWIVISVGVVMVLGMVAKAFTSNRQTSKEDSDDLFEQQKEQNLTRLDDVSERIEDAQSDLEEVEKSAQHKVAETKKGDYSDAKSAVDSFNND